MISDDAFFIRDRYALYVRIFIRYVFSHLCCCTRCACCTRGAEHIKKWLRNQKKILANVFKQYKIFLKNYIKSYIQFFTIKKTLHSRCAIRCVSIMICSSGVQNRGQNATLLLESFATTHQLSCTCHFFTTTSERSLTMSSKRLTQNQWDVLLSDLVRYFDNDDDTPTKTPTKKRKLTRKQFVENWCMQHGIPEDEIPHSSSVTRRLRHKNDHAKHNESRKVICYPLCGCIIDQLLVDEVHKKFGNKYKDDDYNENMCINCNTKRFVMKKDIAADKYIHQHMMAKRGPIVNWSDAILATKKFPLRHVPAELLACPDFLEFQRQPIRYRTFACEDNNPSAMFVSRISGGHHPPFQLVFVKFW